MINRVKDILSPEVLEHITQKEKEGYGRHELVNLLINRRDEPPDELLKAYHGRFTETESASGHTTSYKYMLIEAVLTGIGLKEEIAELQKLLKQAQEEREV